MSSRIAGSSEASAEAKAKALGIPKAYGNYEALLDDPDIQVVHNATPNYLHFPVNAAAIAKRKHVVSDKPLAMTAAEAKKLLDQANAGRHRPRGDVQLPRATRSCSRRGSPSPAARSAPRIFSSAITFRTGS